MLRQRYFLRFSYLGSRYNGVQRQTVRCADSLDDSSSVQAAIEKALKICLRQQDIPSLILSSRTDKNVHANDNTAHVDLFSPTGRSMDPSRFTNIVNNYLRKLNHDIVLRQAVHVPDWFHCRGEAERRSYSYRVAFIRNPTGRNGKDLGKIPLSNGSTCLFIYRNVDIEKIQRACELLEGFHDYATFKSKSYDSRTTLKHMEEITFVPDHNAGSLCEYSRLYSWWKFKLVARSFLYKQVRRIVSATLAVGQGLMPEEKLTFMLNNPHRDSWIKQARLLDGHGLFLDEIQYDARMMTLKAPPPIWCPLLPESSDENDCRLNATRQFIQHGASETTSAECITPLK